VSYEPFLVSPSEPVPVKQLGVVSPVPELHGCDVCWTGPNGLVGVQRKELGDLVASVRDGRLAEQVARMRLLDARVLVVEGAPRWGPTGRLLNARPSITRDALRGVLWSAQQRGLWICSTADVYDTAAAIAHLGRWLAKRRHATFDRRPAARVPGGRAWGVHLLQSFPLVGPVVAGALWDHFDGVPLTWTCPASELASVRGVGPARATPIVSTLPELAAHLGGALPARDVGPSLPFERSA
jgi:ERCC4-type nuclease